MKRKLALLLAGAMTLSMLPTVNLFATSDNTITSFSGNLVEDAVLVERGQFPNSNLIGGPTAVKLDDSNGDGVDLEVYTTGQLRSAVLEIEGNSDVEQVQEGAYLRIEPNGTISANSRIEVTLDGAEWFFRDGVNGPSGKWNSGTVKDTALNALKVNTNSGATTLYSLYDSIKSSSTSTTAGAITAGVTEAASATLINNLRNNIANSMKIGQQNTDNAHETSRENRITGSAYSAFNLQRTFRTLDEDGNRAAAFSGGKYTRYGYADSTGNTSDSNDIIYELTLSANSKVAYITFPNGAKVNTSGATDKLYSADNSTPLVDTMGPDSEEYIYIPLITRITDADADVTITLNGNNTGISSGTWVFGSSTSGGTNTYVDDPKTRRDEFPINMLIIEELKVGAMGNGTFEIAAPSGYEFDEKALDNFQIIAENFGYGTSDTLGDDDYTVKWKTSSREDDYSIIQVQLLTLNSNKSSASGIPGKLVLQNSSDTNYFRLYADEDDAAFDTDVNLTIRNTSGDTGITRQTTVKAGTRKDWTISLTTTGDIPTLINGRYYDDDAENADDETHLAATVIVKENVADAWWLGRITNFTFPEGVKIRKVEIHDTDKLSAADESDLEDAPFYNTNKKTRKVTINENEMTMSGITEPTGNDKAYMEIDFWLSVESGFEGDIELSMDGSSIVEEVEPVVVAKAINPITVKAEVTPVKIGYQYFEVGDITIEETVAGALERNKQIWISVTDRINTDMYFTPGYSVEVTGGNIKVKDKGIAGASTISVGNSKITYNKNTVGGGTIALDVDTISSTASTIKLSNLQLKIDRTVPESTVGYDVYVWGPNVAPNSDIFDYSDVVVDSNDKAKAYANNDLHGEMGIHTKYVEVATPASGVQEGSVLSAVVKVTAASGTAYRNGEQVTVDPAPFIDSNSRMQVPVRALANLLGVTNEEIIWSDSDRTVTINLQNRVVQFAIDSDIMLVNGAQVRMDTTATISRDNDRTYVPFRALGEALGVQVSWDDSTKTATYNSDKE